MIAKQADTQRELGGGRRREFSNKNQENETDGATNIHGGRMRMGSVELF